MSAFDDEILADEASLFAEAGDLADYQGAESSAVGIHAVIDKAFEAYDADQIPMRVTTVSVRVADIPASRQGDTLATPARTWTVQETLEDDGHVRRLWVS